MNRLGTRWRGKIPIPPHAHPLVRGLCERANAQMTTLSEVADRAGLRRKTLSDWRYRRTPKIDDLVAALNVLDFDLAIVERKRRRGR